MKQSDYNEELYQEMLEEPQDEIVNECVQEAYLDTLWD